MNETMNTNGSTSSVYREELRYVMAVPRRPLLCRLGIHKWNWREWMHRTFPHQAFDPLRCTRCPKEKR